MRPLLALCLLLLLCATPARAQQDGGDPDLPSIAPREVEIRGRLEISFPALRRPAPTGLLPQARLQPLPPLPAPEVGALEPPAAAPQALTGGEATPSGFAEAPPPQTGLVEVGGGRYFSRFGRARLNLPLAPNWAFRSRLDYDGTDGFTPFDEDDTQTPADDLRGAATLRTERDAWTAALTADGFLGRHRLYGAQRSPAPNPSLLPRPSRDRYGGGAALHVQAGEFVEARARYDGAQVLTDVFDGANAGSGPSENDNARFERSEQRASGALQLRVPLAGVRAEAGARASTARLSGGSREDAGGSAFDGTVSFLDAGAGAWLLNAGAYRLFAGARALTFSGENGSGTHLAPDVRLEWQAAPRLTLYARTDPAAEANVLADRYRENPSLLYEEAPQPTVRTLDAESGLRFFPRRTLELRAFAGYERAPSYRFYEDANGEDEALYASGVTTARYGQARILEAGAAVSFRRAERLHASLSVAVRNGRLSEIDAALPYFSPVTAQGLFSYGFAGGKGHLQLTGSFESARPVTRTGDREVGAFADFDLAGRYAVTPAIGIVVRLQNVPAGALERYDRYPHPPLVFETGLRVNL